MPKTTKTLEITVKVVVCSLQNFGSYKELEFNFANQGLTLIQGPTGSGKSTLMDAIPWVLFGKTAKDGTVDEVRSWNSKETTSGRVAILCGEKEILVSRHRGPNDLYFSVLPEVHEIRGKDLQDTQRLINEQLGIDYETYLSGAYFHEFSQTAQFFTATAKNRRMICEQIVDLSLPKKLQEKAKESIKHTKNDIYTIDVEMTSLQSNISLLERIQVEEINKESLWNNNHRLMKQNVSAMYDKFEANRKKTHSKNCPICKTVLEEPHEVIDESENPHAQRLADLELMSNPHVGAAKDYSKEIRAKRAELNGLTDKRDDLSGTFNDLNRLSEILDVFRSTLISNTISYIQDKTNDLLTRHFDAEIRVEFSATTADKLEVTIQKEGNECSYTQLSKGQRQILKLAFGVAVMQGVSNHKGVHFDQIFFDEALDGLDENMKVKAFHLLEELSLTHNSVFIVEHSEGLKALFNNSYKVSLVNGESQICQN